MKSFSNQMGRRPRIFPKELVQFPQNSLYHKASSVLLPCPPHRISPFWEKEYKSRAELMSLLNKPHSPQAPHCSYQRNTQKQSPPWLKNPAFHSKMPQLHPRAMAVPLPHLHHLAKPSPHHKHPTVTPVLPQSRNDIPTRKTTTTLTPIEQCLIPPLGSKNHLESSLDSEHHLETLSGSDHLPKIFPVCDHSVIEDLTHLNQKDPTPPFPDHQTKIALRERPRSRPSIASIVSDTQTANIKPLLRTPTPPARVFPKPKRRIKAANALLGLFNIDPVLQPIAKSLPCPIWTRTPNFRTSVIDYWVNSQSLKEAQTSRDTLSLLQCLNHQPGPLAAPTTHLNQRNQSTTICRYNPHLLCRPSPIAHVSVQTDYDSWENRLLRKYLLESCPCSPVLESLTTTSESTARTPEPTATTSEPTTTMPESTDRTPEPTATTSEPTTTMPESTARTPESTTRTPEPTATTSVPTTTIPESTARRSVPTSKTSKPTATLSEPTATIRELTATTSEPALHVSIKTDKDSEVVSQETDDQDTSESKSGPETDSIPEPAVHSSIQTDQIPWEAIFPETDLQEIFSSSPEPETDTTREPTMHVSVQTELTDSWEIISSETDEDESLADQDDRIALLDLDPQDATLSSPQQWATPPPTPYPWAEDMPNNNALVMFHPELKQRQAISQKIDQLAIVSPRPDLVIEAISEPIVYESVLIKQEAWKTTPPILPGISDHQAIITEENHEITPPLDLNGQDTVLATPAKATTPLPSPDQQQSENIYNHDAQVTLDQNLEQWATQSEETDLKENSETEHTPDVTDPISDMIEEETFEIIDIMPLRIEFEETNEIVKDHWAIFLPLDSNDEENTVSGPDHPSATLLISSFSSDQKQASETTSSDLAQDLAQIEQEYEEMSPSRIERETTILAGQDEGATPPVDLDPQNPAPLVLELQITPPPSPDQQPEDILDSSDQVSLQPESEHSNPMSPETELQKPIVKEEYKRVTPPMSLDHKVEIIVSSPDHCPTPPSSPEKQSEPILHLSIQATSPTNRKHSAKLSEGQEKITPLPSPNPSVPPPAVLEKQAKAGTDPINLASTAPVSLDDDETIPLSPEKTTSPPSPNHQTEPPTGHDHQPETKLSYDHQDEVESGFQHQSQIVQKRQPELRLNYIKPYTILGGTVSDKTVHAIINSIPQERIKNDISKQILLPMSLDRYSPCEYMVCLICSSWIPDGCPHEGMKYPCEAQLLATPISMSMSEELINVTFSLKCPQATASALFCSSDIPRRNLKQSSEDVESNHSEPMVTLQSRPKWLHFILSKSLPQGKKDISRSPEPSIDKVFEEGREGEMARIQRTTFRSLLERFQWRLKGN
ncbi:mucin-2-like isoform X1 [Monodelphis domestica]|uniref:mucin-2-like isoform X1 n=2 Tax=Monodelphis domestica TaxID=13616 RepID=UPI0024E1DAC4|nr:mucin-2-like isoform X1 [Monodelphis domestica]